jgi:hypothetical protein
LDLYVFILDYKFTYEDHFAKLDVLGSYKTLDTMHCFEMCVVVNIVSGKSIKAEY